MKSHAGAALVLRRTPYRDADLVLSLFTESLGQVAALARSARRSQRRFGGSLEPFHTLAVELDEAPGAELLTLQSSRIVTARARLYEHLGALEAAGKLSTWIRHATAAHTPEPLVWELAESCLSTLDGAAGAEGGSGGRSAQAILASHGLELLSACGWRLELERCVLSGAPCPSGKSAMIDPERGGLVSRAEGGAPFVVSGAARQRLIAAQAGRRDALEEQDAALALELIERCLRAHAGLG